MNRSKYVYEKRMETYATFLLGNLKWLSLFFKQDPFLEDEDRKELLRLYRGHMLTIWQRSQGFYDPSFTFTDLIGEEEAKKHYQNVDNI